jgi:hypothetical protein
MESETLGLQKITKPLYYQNVKRKTSKKKKSSDFKKPKSSMYKGYDNNNIMESYKRPQSPVPNNNLNSSLPFKLNKISLQNDSDEKINLNFNNLSSLFGIDVDNIIDFPEFNNEKIIDFNVYAPFTKEVENDDDINNNYEEDLSPICKYGLRYINDDIYINENMKNEKIVLIQSYIRSYFLRKKLNFNLLNRMYLETKNISKIVLLQKHIRSFLARLRIRKKIIMNYIKQRRKAAINKIINKMRSYNNILKTKKLIFIKNKIEERNKYAKYIQETFRNYKFYNSFKKLMKEMNEKYFIIYPFKGNKVEIIIYLEENNNLIPRKYTFYYNKLLKCFTLFINPEKLYAGKYKCQFVIDDIVICERNYPYIQYKNELYNIISFNINRKKKFEKRKKRKEKSKNNKNIDNNNENTKKLNYNSILAKAGKNYQNNFYKEEEYNDELEDIKEEEDEGKSTTSKDNINELRSSKAKDYIDDELDFTEEDIINIKRLKGNNIILTDYQKLKEELMYKNPVSKEEKIRRTSFKSFNFNY